MSVLFNQNENYIYFGLCCHKIHLNVLFFCTRIINFFFFCFRCHLNFQTTVTVKLKKKKKKLVYIDAKSIRNRKSLCIGNRLKMKTTIKNFDIIKYIKSKPLKKWIDLICDVYSLKSPLRVFAFFTTIFFSLLYLTRRTKRATKNYVEKKQFFFSTIHEISLNENCTWVHLLCTHTQAHKSNLFHFHS